MGEKPSPIKAYIYSIKNGKLRVHEGFVFAEPFRERVQFRGKNKKTLCSKTPGEVYSGSVWFLERDDQKALKLFIEFEEKLVFQLQERVQNHLSTISQLKGALI